MPIGDTSTGNGTYEDFATGFPGVDYFTNTRDAKYRPAGVTTGPDGSLYISETEKGRIWRVIYTGEVATSASESKTRRTVAIAQTYAAIGADTPGGKI